MTKTDFIAQYCARSQISTSLFQEHMVALLCTCGDAKCAGWAAVSKDEDSIAAHQDLYGPKGS